MHCLQYEENELAAQVCSRPRSRRLEGCPTALSSASMATTDIVVRWVSDGPRMGVRIVTAQSTRHMHYIMTCLSGDCVVLVTITVTTNSCTKETLCSPGVGCVRASLDYGARDTLDCTLVINTICALRMRATALLDA